jgi:hypothetical protein
MLTLVGMEGAVPRASWEMVNKEKKELEDVVKQEKWRLRLHRVAFFPPTSGPSYPRGSSVPTVPKTRSTLFEPNVRSLISVPHLRDQSLGQLSLNGARSERWPRVSNAHGE